MHSVLVGEQRRFKIQSGFPSQHLPEEPGSSGSLEEPLKEPSNQVALGVVVAPENLLERTHRLPRGTHSWPADFGATVVVVHPMPVSQLVRVEP